MTSSASVSSVLVCPPDVSVTPLLDTVATLHGGMSLQEGRKVIMCCVCACLRLCGTQVLCGFLSVTMSPLVRRSADVHSI